MSTATLQPIFRKDYRQPAYWIREVELDFILGETETRVTSRLTCERNSSADEGSPLELDGEGLELLRVALDGEILEESRYEAHESGLRVIDLPAQFTLETEVLIHPESNTTMEGLYKSSGNFCSQCEAEGFRHITYFLDRPDVMATYRVRVEADEERYPVLLSNGNRIAEGKQAEGRHWVQWEDPFPKPSYLFALVAGNLLCHRGDFKTRSGRNVDLEIWVEPQNIDACEHALVSLQKSMKWDEEVFGLEYDLDLYMIVAVNDFNMGAMENKGLNVFNTKYVLAKPETATDDDYENIERVIAHEYFHNWTGNRVTCRDWFQLTLKEGLTVFRDQQFSADMSSAPLRRILEVKALRTTQFAEDAGPMAHPIRPESYVEMNNFYTSTVYNKGAEVIRMYHTLLGETGFRKGMDLYFQRHDNSAVECDDFRAAMADANGVDLGQFERWYRQAGTPVVKVQVEHHAGDEELHIEFQQEHRQVPDLDPPEPLHIPIRLSLLDANGHELPLRLVGEDAAGTVSTERVLELTEETQTFRFAHIRELPTPSLFRGFSAPVKLEYERDDAALVFLMSHDQDAFNRWDAGQELAQRVLLRNAQNMKSTPTVDVPAEFIGAVRAVLTDDQLDGSLKSLALTLPSEMILGQQMKVVDVEAIHAARRETIKSIATSLRSEFESIYDACHDRGPYRNDQESIDQRRLKNVCLSYLSAIGDKACIARCAEQFHSATSMTDAQAALAGLIDHDCHEREESLAAFYEKWKEDPLVLDKWFAVQATSTHPETFSRVSRLADHPDFTLANPNRARSLLGTFARFNQLRFHEVSGVAYEFIARKTLEIDRLNPQLAAFLISSFNTWKRFGPTRQALIRQQLERVIAERDLSRDVREIAQRALDN